MEDKELVEKISRVVTSLEKRGGLKLFALNWQAGVNQWDIIVSADWIDYQNLRDNISDIFQEVKKEFNGQYSLTFSGIHPLAVTEQLVQDVTKAMNVSSGSTNLSSVQFGSIFIEKMILLYSKV